MAAHVLEETRTDALKRRPRLGNARAQPHLLHHSHVSHVAAGNPTSERASPRPYLTCTLLSSLPSPPQPPPALPPLPYPLALPPSHNPSTIRLPPPPPPSRTPSLLCRHLAPSRLPLTIPFFPTLFILLSLNPLEYPRVPNLSLGGLILPHTHPLHTTASFFHPTPSSRLIPSHPHTHFPSNCLVEIHRILLHPPSTLNSLIHILLFHQTASWKSTSYCKPLISNHTS